MSAITIDRPREVGRHDGRTSNTKPLPDGVVSTVDVCYLTGLSYRQINWMLTQYGAELGMPNTAPGSGRTLHIPVEMIPTFHVIAGLRERGVSLRKVMANDHQGRMRVLGALRKAERAE